MFRWPFDTFFNTAISFRTYRRAESRQIRDLHEKDPCGVGIVSSRWGDAFTLETPSGGVALTMYSRPSMSFLLMTLQA